jgi:hypothetical protein
MAKKIKLENEAIVEPVAPKPSLVIDRNNLNLISAGFFSYKAKDLLACKEPGAFTAINAKNFGIRSGDIILCSNESEAVLVVVK